MVQIYLQSLSRISPLLMNSMTAILVQDILTSCLIMWSASLVSPLLQPEQCCWNPCHIRAAPPWMSSRYISSYSEQMSNTAPTMNFSPWYRSNFSSLLCLSFTWFQDSDLCLNGTFPTRIFPLGVYSSWNALPLGFCQVCSFTCLIFFLHVLAKALLCTVSKFSVLLQHFLSSSTNVFICLSLYH